MVERAGSWAVWWFFPFVVISLTLSFFKKEERRRREKREEKGELYVTYIPSFLLLFTLPLASPHFCLSLPLSPLSLFCLFAKQSKREKR